MYFEDENGRVCSPAIDILWSDPDNIKRYGKFTTLKASIATKYVLYDDVAQALPGLQPPVVNGQAWGQELDAWFEQNGGTVQTVMGGAQDHVVDVLYVFKQYTSANTTDLYKKYMVDKARLVVESVYWIAPVGKGGRYLTSGRSIYEQNAASAGYYYGTVKEIAKYLEEKVDLLGNKYGGDYTGSLTNYTFVTALFTPYEDEFSHYTLPKFIAGDNDSTTGKYSVYVIQKDKAGYGMHIIRCDNAKEQWYTYKTPSGLSGGSPGAAPEMPNPLGLTDEARPITIIKYYEYRTIENGKPSYKKAAGPFTRKQVCRIISVQDIFRHFSCNSFSTS